MSSSSPFRLKLSRCLPERPPPPSTTTAFHFEELEELRNRPIDQLYSIGALLGSGAVASVYRAVERATGKHVAVKVVSTTNLSKRQVKDLTKEIRILSAVTHANIVHLIRAYKSETHCYLVQELVSGGELFEHIIQNGHVPESQALQITRHLASAVAYLHCKGIAHRDIKPENVLMESAVDGAGMCSVKLADFGLACEIHTSSATNLTRFCGTPMYVAPEIVDRATHGFKADVWSLGVLLYVILAGETPFPDDDDTEQLWVRIKQGDWNFNDSPVWSSISMEAKDLISKMLVVDPIVRLSAQGVLNHCWFAAPRAPPSPPRSPSLAVAVSSSVAASSSSSSLSVVPAHRIRRRSSQSFAMFRRIATRSIFKIHRLPSFTVAVDTDITTTNSNNDLNNTTTNNLNASDPQSCKAPPTSTSTSSSASTAATVVPTSLPACIPSLSFSAPTLPIPPNQPTRPIPSILSARGKAREKNFPSICNER